MTKHSHQGKGIATKIADELENHVLETGMQKSLPTLPLPQSHFLKNEDIKLLMNRPWNLEGNYLLTF